MKAEFRNGNRARSRVVESVEGAIGPTSYAPGTLWRGGWCDPIT